MPTLSEALSQHESDIKSVVASGAEQISSDQVVVFVKYARVMLPIDGYVFWIRSDLAPKANVSSGSLPPIVHAKGSLHYTTNIEQQEDHSLATNAVIFSSEVQVDALNEVSANEMYLGTFEGLRFAFSERSAYYEQADMHHYTGNAVLPTMAPLIVDDVSQLPITDVIASNSIPMWLNMAYSSIFFPRFVPIPVYPSFLVPENAAPPYAVAHVRETTALQSAPYVDSNSNHYLLVSDWVKITLYGVDNARALMFQDFVNNQSLNTGTFGIMNMPAVIDEKDPQRELNAIAQKKSIEFQVSYIQSAMYSVAKQLILKALLQVNIGDYEDVVPGFQVREV